MLARQAAAAARLATTPRPSRQGRPALYRPRDSGAALDALVVCFIVWFLNPFAPFLDDFDAVAQLTAAAAAAAPASAGAQFLQLSWAPIHATVICLALARWRDVADGLAMQRLLLVLLGLALVSAIWSVNPEVTLRRSIALAGSSLFGVYLAVVYDHIKLLRLLARAFAIVIVASLVFAFVQPEIATSSVLHDGEWRGVFVNKNALGQMMLLSCLVRSILIVADRRIVRHLPWLALSIALLLLSGAKTALIVGLALFATALFVRKFRVDRRSFSFAFWLTAVLGALALMIAGPSFTLILTLLGKDPTLTGRTEIWSLVWNAVQPRLWIGYGYGAFWSNPDGPAGEIWDVLNWHVPNAHSGFLELWLGLGLVGVMLFAALVVSTMRDILRRSTMLSEAGAMWMICYPVMFHAYMLGESATLEQNAANWMLFCTVIAASRWRARRLAVVATPISATHGAFPSPHRSPAPTPFTPTAFGVMRRPIPIAATPLRPRLR